MTKRKSPDRETNWNKVFNALVKLSQNLQHDRAVLEEKVEYLNGVIHKMSLERHYVSSKSELLLGLKEREALICKRRCENANEELADLREGFHYLCEKPTEPQFPSDEAVISKGNHQTTKLLQEELKRLKTELEKSKSEKKSLISAHLAEKKFVWNQYKRLESRHAERIIPMEEEIKSSNEKLGELSEEIGELRTSNKSLKTRIAEVESESNRKDFEISRLVDEIEALKAKSLPPMPSLRRCSSQLGKRNRESGTSASEKEPDSDARDVEKLAATRTRQTARKSTGGKAPKKQLSFKGSSSSSKRKAIEEMSDTPKLFSSSFKVPKLKPSASPRPV